MPATHRVLFEIVFCQIFFFSTIDLWILFELLFQLSSKSTIKTKDSNNRSSVDLSQFWCSVHQIKLKWFVFIWSDRKLLFMISHLINLFATSIQKCKRFYCSLHTHTHTLTHILTIFIFRICFWPFIKWKMKNTHTHDSVMIYHKLAE